MERNRNSIANNSNPVTFPESYPFSLLSHLPKNSTLSNQTTSFDVKADFCPGLGEAAIVLLVLILSATKKHLVEFLQSNFLEIEGRDNLAAFLIQFFKVSASILNNDAFPNNWLNVNILAHKTILKMMDPVVTLLVHEFIPSEDSQTKFDTHLWRDGFYVLLKLLSSDQLVIEEFTPQVRYSKLMSR